MPSEEENRDHQGEACEATRMTCDVLCSLSSAGSPSMRKASADGCVGATLQDDDSDQAEKRSCSKYACPKQLQLPMFLSKTYHMIDKCDETIAGWGESGDSFVVKNVEKFAGSVLPLYFKHSNFSSFARQLNFYGFRKLRSDPILTTEIDPNTSCWVRFFHENFQKDRPELMHNIKRATKTDQQSKDEVDSLKAEVRKLKDEMGQMKIDYDRKLAELSYDFNRRISSMTAEQDKLALVIQQSLAGTPGSATPVLQGSHDLLHSLSHAAMSLQRHLPSVAPPPHMTSAGTKRPSGSPDENGKKAKTESQH